jgi:hypothetical protein
MIAYAILCAFCGLLAMAVGTVLSKSLAALLLSIAASLAAVTAP